MYRFHTLHIVIVVLVCCTNTAIAQTEVFLSFSDFGDGDAFENSVQTLRVGESGTAFIWTDGTVEFDGLQMQVRNFTPLVDLSQPEVFNPDIVFFDGDSELIVGPRWDNTSVAELTFNRLHYFAFGGLGINPDFDGSGAVMDQLYDPLSDAFLFGSFDFTVLDQGAIDIEIHEAIGNSNGIFMPTVRGLTINSIAVPEPSSASVLFLLMSVAAARYWRHNTKQVS